MERKKAKKDLIQCLSAWRNRDFRSREFFVSFKHSRKGKLHKQLIERLLQSLDVYLKALGLKTETHFVCSVGHDSEESKFWITYPDGEEYRLNVVIYSHCYPIVYWRQNGPGPPHPYERKFNRVAIATENQKLAKQLKNIFFPHEIMSHYRLHELNCWIAPIL